MMHRLLKARKSGVKFIVVDPRRMPTVKKLADLHLQLRPATDGALALSIINVMIKNVMIKEGLYDVDFVERWVYGFEELKRYIEGFIPEKTEKITWIPAEEIMDVAEMLLRYLPVTFVLSAQSTTHNRNTVQNHRAILALMTLTGCIDVPGGIIIPARQLLQSGVSATQYSVGGEICCRKLLKKA